MKTKQAIYLIISLIVMLLFVGCGMSGKETTVPNITATNPFYTTSTYLSTSSPTFNIDDLVFTAPGHFERQIIFNSDNTKAYFSIYGRPNAEFDVFQADYIGGQWTEPTINGMVNINTVSNELVHCLSADGTTMYLVSDRAGGQGGYDIYMSTQNAGVWQTPVNMGPTINTASDDETVWAFDSGDKLYITSDNGGGFDFWYAEKVGGIWQAPTKNIFERVNHPVGTEYALVRSADGESLYLSSTRAGNSQIYKSRWVDNRWDYPVLMGVPFDQNYIVFVASDESEIYYYSFTLASPGDTYNDSNIWVAEQN
ncbi:TolB family protein [Candidatus Margulisiibacteriota bacterium]